MHCPHTSTPQQHTKGKEASAAKERKKKHEEKRPKTTKSKNFFFRKIAKSRESAGVLAIMS
jgi:hypothetical protein